MARPLLAYMILQRNGKLIFKNIFLITVAILFAYVFFAPEIESQAPGTRYLHGYAWSDNIGWISFEDSSVYLDTDNKLKGYAWSDNIGWIMFNPPGAAEAASYANGSSGPITGWIRACAGSINGDCTGGDRTDGWDGWIKMSGSWSNGAIVDEGSNWLEGYAWGGDVVGWISFNCKTGGPNGSNICVTFDYKVMIDPLTGGVFSVDLKANGSNGPVAVPVGSSSITLSWTSIPSADWCNATGSWTGSKPASGSETDGPITSDMIYTITCGQGSYTSNDTVIVSAGPCGTFEENDISFDPDPPYMRVPMRPATRLSSTRVGITIDPNICFQDQIKVSVAHPDYVIKESDGTKYSINGIKYFFIRKNDNFSKEDDITVGRTGGPSGQYELKFLVNILPETPKGNYFIDLNFESVPGGAGPYTKQIKLIIDKNPPGYFEEI